MNFIYKLVDVQKNLYYHNDNKLIISKYLNYGQIHTSCMINFT